MRSSCLPVSLLLLLALPTGCRSGGGNPYGATSSSRPPPESTQAQPATVPGGDPVGKKFETWLAAFNSGDGARMERVWSDAKDAGGRVAMDLTAAQRTGGLELHRVEEATPSEMVAVVRAKGHGRWLCLRFDVDPDPPHAIHTIALRPTGAPSDADDAKSAAAPFDEKARAQVIQALLRELNRSYVYPEKAAAIEREIDGRRRQHVYDGLPSRIGFARALTEDMQRVTHDKHLHVDVGCSRGAARPPVKEPPPSASDRPRVFAEARRLDGNIAYIDIATFGVPVELAREEVRETMAAAADAAAIVLDVRHNGGGEPETVALVSSYLFGSEPVHLNSLYWRPSGRTDDFFTDPKVQGAKFGPKKPVYVLTSARTFSAAEEFTYNLQALKRAVVVGETTGGGAHPGEIAPLPQGFTVFVPSGRAINPVTNTNWEGTGVEPDVEVPAEKALQTAREHARARLAAGETSSEGAPSK